MAQPVERHVHGLRIVIDRDLCVGFGDCIDEAPEAFELDDEGVAVYTSEVESVDRQRLLSACRSCPVDALSAFEGEKQVAP